VDQYEARVPHRELRNHSLNDDAKQADAIKWSRGDSMTMLVCRLWKAEEGEDIAEYAVMLAVILVIVIGTVRLIGTNTNNAFSSVASTMQ
jgi:Flp pilus assembly pilin Flp